MPLKSPFLFVDEPFWDKHTTTASLDNPFDLDAGPFPKEIQSRLDVHYALEIGILLEGRVRRFCEDYAFDVEPGQIWLCGPWEPHSRKTLDWPNDRIVIHVLPQTLAGSLFWPIDHVNFITPFLTEPQFRPQIALEDRDRIIHLGRLIEWVYRHGPDHQKTLLYLLLVEVVLMLAMKNWKPPESFQNQRSSSNFLKINPAVHLIFNSQTRITEQQAAKACGLNVKTFDVLFKNMMGTTFSRFALQYRLYRVARQLLDSRESVKKIAEQWDFTDASHLNRSFCKQYGSTPRDFRKRYTDMQYYQIADEITNNEKFFQ